MKGLTWLFAAAATLVPAIASANDPWNDTRPDTTQQPQQPQADDVQIGTPRLGVRVMALTDDLRQYFAAPSGEGILVAKVEKGTPAARVGLQAGDVIVSVQGQNVASATDVRDALSSLKAGDKVKLDVIRDKQHLTLTTPVASDTVQSSLDWMRDVMPWFDPERLETPT